jgi:hypothetical protein
MTTLGVSSPFPIAPPSSADYSSTTAAHPIAYDLYSRYPAYYPSYTTSTGGGGGGGGAPAHFYSDLTNFSVKHQPGSDFAIVSSSSSQVDQPTIVITTQQPLPSQQLKDLDVKQERSGGVVHSDVIAAVAGVTTAHHSCGKDGMS